MTSTYHILRTSNTAHSLGAAAGMWAGRVGSPTVIDTSDGAAMSTPVFGTDRNLDVLAARGAG
jgi:hypothetical protein